MKILGLVFLATAALAQTVVTNPTTSQNIIQPGGTSFAVNRQGSVRFADQFSGADACARIATAVGDLPATGGVVDARKFEGVQTCATNPFAASTKPVTLLLGAATFNLSVQMTVNTPASGQSVMQGLGESTKIALQNATSFVALGSNTKIKDLMIQSSLTTAINGGIFTQGTTNVTVENITFSGGGHQLNLNTVNNFRIIGTRHTAITATGGSAIAIYMSDHGTISNVRIEGFILPTGSVALRGIGISNSHDIDVENPIIRDLDATQLPNFAALGFNNSYRMNLTGGQLSNNKGADGFLSENGSVDINIVGTVSSNNGTCPTCAGTNGGTGDGFDIFNSHRVHLSGCVANGNGRWTTNTHPGIEIFTSSDVTVENCDASDSGGNGVIVEGSARTALIGVSAQRNQADGVYVAPDPSSNQSSIQIIGGQYNDNGLGNLGLIYVNGMYFAGATVATVQGATATNTSGSTQTYGARLENTSRGVFLFNNFRGNPGGEIQDSVGKSPIFRDDGTTNMIHSVGSCCS